MKRFRSLLFWIHLSAGLLAGLVILIMSITGVALTYQRQMQWWADTRHYHAEPAPGAERLPAARLIDAATLAAPSTAATSLTLRAEPDAPAAVGLGNRTVFVNPFTAEVYGEGTGNSMRAFFSTMVSWHRYLAMSGESRGTGRAITGASNLLFLFLVLSGLYLWWPKTLTRAQFRNITWFRSGLRPKARDFNWHTVLGFWSAIPLALVVYSGVVISYPWAGNMVYQAFGETPPTGRGGGPGRAAGPGGRAGGPGGRGRGTAAPANTQASTPRPRTAVEAVDVEWMLQSAMRYDPAWKILTAPIPAPGAETATVTIDRGDGGQPHLRGTLTMDVAEGRVVRFQDPSAQSAGRRARSFLRFAHTGEYFGMTGQTIAGLVSAAGVVLVYTGLALSLRRFRAWRVGRRPRPADSAGA